MYRTALYGFSLLFSNVNRIVVYIMEELNKFEQEIKLKTFVKGNEFTNEDIEMFKKLHSLLVNVYSLCKYIWY